ncbi:hypothetical protein [Nocardia concava]|uniref:hypothetical protein n=1 Tax=Nocardia concava TaxID=257281 RepID=UPI0003045044|nr:hypothetical protein [Nocardia concava]
MSESRGVYYDEAARRQAADAARPYDPLNLCVFATVALLTWLIGPWAVAAFGLLGLVGYTRAWRKGLRHSRCWLRDVRLVLLYLAVLTASGIIVALS